MKKYIIYALLCAILTACADKKSDKGVSACDCEIPAKDIPAYKERALLGNPDDAYHLRYSFASSGDKKESAYWYIVSIENMLHENKSLEVVFHKYSAVEIYNLSSNIEMNKKDYKDILRAQYWGRLAKEKGEEDSKYPLNAVEKDLKKKIFGEIKLSSIEKQALLGSTKSAIQLANNYKTKNDLTQETYWTRIAVQNGDTDSIHRLGSLLQQSPDPQDQMRAKYWLGLEKQKPAA